MSRKKATAPPTDVDEGAGEALLEKLPRHVEFLRWYLGRPQDTFKTLRQFKTIGLTLDGRRKIVCANKQSLFHRFAVLSVEGDNVFDVLESSSRQDATLIDYMHCEDRLTTEVGRSNATMCCLHYGNGTPSFPFMSYRVVLAQSSIQCGERVRVCPLSILRCDNEIHFYAQLASTSSSPVTPKDVAPFWARHEVAHWPPRLAYYHGIGARHVSSEAVVSFPANLLRLSPCPAIGEGQLEVVAAEYLHEWTCFLYGGAARETFVTQRKRPRDDIKTVASKLPSDPQFATAVADDEVYNIFLSTERTCVGQNITRFINHRYHMGGFGNVVLVNVMIPVARDDEDIERDVTSGKMTGSSSKAPARLSHRVIKDRNTVCLNIPFFLTKTCIQPGTQLVTSSYGAEYDAKLERITMTSMHWVPFACTSCMGAVPSSTLLSDVSPAYAGTYLPNVEEGSIVWRPGGAEEVADMPRPWADMYLVCAHASRGALVLQRLQHPTMIKDEDGEGSDLVLLTVPSSVPRGGGEVYLSSCRDVVWMLEGVDYEEVPQLQQAGSMRHIRLVRSWAEASSARVYALMSSNPQWFEGLIPFCKDDL
jgi:hypothetical protein